MPGDYHHSKRRKHSHGEKCFDYQKEIYHYVSLEIKSYSTNDVRNEQADNSHAVSGACTIETNFGEIEKVVYLF